MTNCRAFILSSAFLAACSDMDSAVHPGVWEATHDTIGDTIVVHTTAGSVWGQPMELIEELAIGARDPDTDVERVVALRLPELAQHPD